jgi:hypothetical protein
MIAVGTLLSPSRLAGADNGLRPVRDLKLAKDVGHMITHGLLAQDETTSDLPIVAPLGNQPQHLPFSVGQVWKFGWERRLSQRHKECHQPLGNFWAEQAFPTRNRVQRPQQYRLIGAFQHIPACPSAHGGKDGIIILKHCEDDDPHMRACPQYLASRFDAIHIGHLYVHENHVRLKGSRLGNRFLSTGRLTDHVNIGDRGQQSAQPLTKQGVVVSDHDAYGVHASSLFGSIFHEQWQAHPHACPASRYGCDGACSAQFLRTLPHRRHSHPRTDIARNPAPVINHL